jgi:hypothetical protein
MTPGDIVRRKGGGPRLRVLHRKVLDLWFCEDLATGEIATHKSTALEPWPTTEEKQMTIEALQAKLQEKEKELTQRIDTERPADPRMRPWWLGQLRAIAAIREMITNDDPFLFDLL